MPSNLEQMNTAVENWITEARKRKDGASALEKRAGWVAEQIGRLGTAEEPPHLAGLTVFDLTRAESSLRQAAAELKSDA